MLNAEIDFSGCIGDVAARLLGSPNKKLSNRRTLRFGSHGKLAIQVDGLKRGTWFDHSEGAGGGTLDLIVRVRGGNRREALEWLRTEQLINSELELVPSTPQIAHEPRRLSDWGRQLWSACLPITPGDAAGRYLRKPLRNGPGLVFRLF